MAAAATKNDAGITSPKKGETFRCEKCGMELQITKDCGCDEPGHVHLHCCDREMVKQ